jgi:hypothetical protein
LPIIRRQNAEIALPISFFLTLVIAGFALTFLSPLLSYLKLLLPASYEKYIQIMMKSLSIMVTGSLAVDICRESGSVSAANALELAVRCELLYLSLPVLQELIELMMQILSA